jgi:HEAT repeat protein
MGIHGTPEIRMLKEKRDVEGLIKALKDASIASKDVGMSADAAALSALNMCEDAASVLGEIKDERAVEPLIEALSHKAPGIIIVAAKALGEIGDKRAIEPLTRAYHHPKVYVRYPIVIALSQFKDDERALMALEEVLRDPDPDLRRIAAIALGKVK